jgi:hypothetical protein
VFGKVPVVNAEVDVAYIAPPEVNEVRFVPPLAVGKVPVVKALVDVAYRAPPDVNEVKFVPPFEVGNVPDTSAVKDTAPKVGAPEAFPCKTVVLVPAEVVAKAVVVEAYVMPY